MKPLMLAITVALSACSQPKVEKEEVSKPWNPASEEPPLTSAWSEPGRFQVVAGRRVDNGTEVPVMIRIDTLTGATWQLSDMPATVSTPSGSERVNIAVWWRDNEKADYLKQLPSK